MSKFWSTKAPNIADYMQFVPSETMASLSSIDQEGNYRINVQYSSTLVKLYILFNWQLYKNAGVTDDELWQAFSSLSNDEGSLKFRVDGTQLNYTQPLRKLNGNLLGNLTLRHIIGNYWLFIAFIVILILCAVSLLGVIVAGTFIRGEAPKITNLQRQLFVSSIN